MEIKSWTHTFVSHIKKYKRQNKSWLLRAIKSKVYSIYKCQTSLKKSIYLSIL